MVIGRVCVQTDFITLLSQRATVPELFHHPRTDRESTQSDGCTVSRVSMPVALIRPERM
jgi:hypothetical protein